MKEKLFSKYTLYNLGHNNHMKVLYLKMQILTDSKTVTQQTNYTFL